MRTINLIQGTPEWLAHRANYFNASDAPAMMGCGKKSRTALLDEYKQYREDINDFTQKIFNKGHEFEAKALKFAEQIIGEDLFPLVGVKDSLSASFDGITLDEYIIYEHKTLNAEIIKRGPTQAHKIQMQHQLSVSGAEKCLFLATKWNGDQMVDNYHEWIMPDYELQHSILLGWAQFAKDLETHELKAKPEAPIKAVAMELPSVVVQVKGELTACNIADVRPVFDKFLAEATVNLVTDNDFAEAEAQSKVARDIAKRCVATEKSIIDQTASISEITRELRLYADKFNALALQQEKAVKTQKENIKRDIVNSCTAKFNDLLRNLSAQISPILLVTEQPNLIDALKNKRTITSLNESADAEIARVSAIATNVVNKVLANLVEIRKFDEYKFLFNDLQSLAYLDAEHLKLTVATRIDAHKQAEAEKLERIEAEAKRKAEAEQTAKLEEQRQKIYKEEQAKIEAEQARLAEIDRALQEQTKAEQDEQDEHNHTFDAYLQSAEPLKVVIVKPSNDEIIKAVALYFNCSKEQAEIWIREFK